MNHIIVIPNFLITKASFKKAYNLCKDIDEKDTAYMALTIELDIEFVTNDKELYKGLRSKGFAKVILLDDFIRSLQNSED